MDYLRKPLSSLISRISRCHISFQDWLGQLSDYHDESAPRIWQVKLAVVERPPGVVLNSLVICLLFVFTFLRSENSYGDSSTKRLNTPIDVLVLVDSSASMRVSDSNHLRHRAVATFAASLGVNDRIAIGEFAEKPTILGEFQSPTSTNALAEQISSLGESGQYTDMLAAVNKGYDLFHSQGRTGVRKLIVLLSDGKMDPSPAAYTPELATKKLLYTTLPLLKSSGLMIHTIALTGDADKKLMSQIAVSTDGVGWIAESPNQLESILRDLLLMAKRPTDGDLHARKIEINEEFDEAILYIKETPGSKMTLVSPSGLRFDPLKKGSGDNTPLWFRNENFYLVNLSNPEIGEWSVEGLIDPDEFIALFTDLKVSIRWPYNFFVGSRGSVEAMLLEGSRAVSIPALSGAVRTTVQVIPVDRVAEPIVSDEMSDDGSPGDFSAHDGIFSREVVLDQVGRYKVVVTMRGPGFERSAEQLFEVSEVLMRSAIEEIDEPFDQLVEGYKENGHKDTHAHGSHGAGGDEKELTDSINHPLTDEISSKKSDEHGKDGDHEHTRQEGFPVIKVSVDQSVEQTYKRHEISVVAIFEDGTNENVPLYRSKKSSDTFYGNLGDLSHPGNYQLQATLRAKPKWGREQVFRGPWLPFIRAAKIKIPTKKVVEDSTRSESVDSEDKPSQGQSSTGFLISLIAILTLNIVAGQAIWFVLKNREQSKQPKGLDFEYPRDLEEIVVVLEKVAEESEISLEDPRIGGKPLQALPETLPKIEEPQTTQPSETN